VIGHFSVTMPGQPPSWNHMYRWTTRNVNGRQVRIQVLTDEANLYKSQLTMVARASKPGSFQPVGGIIVAYTMRLGRDLDADNVMKAVNDSLAVALGVNDKLFLPVTLDKTSGNKNPHVIIDVFDADAWRPSVEPL
jgi:hypothetical protein